MVKDAKQEWIQENNGNGEQQNNRKERKRVNNGKYEKIKKKGRFVESGYYWKKNEWGRGRIKWMGQRSRNRVGIDRSITYNLQRYRVKCI